MKSSIKKFTALAIAVILTLSVTAVTSFAAYKGDVDKDNDVDSTDALIVLKASVGSNQGELDMAAADMDGNGEINSTDALKILRTSVNLEEKQEIQTEPAPAPSTKEEIVAAYNNAVNKVVDEKAGYTKSRNTVVKEMNGGDLMSLAEGVVKDFLGDGITNYTNTKGTSKYFLNASLTADNVTDATCQLSDGNYIITLNLKDGQSTATKSSSRDTSALAKSGLFTGNVANSDYDYLSSASIYSAATSASSSLKIESIKSKNTNVKIVAAIDAATGKLVTLTIDYDWTVEMSNVKYIVVSVSKADGKAQTSVALSNFQW